MGNTAVGAQALLSNIGDNTELLPKGAFNTAVGLNALTANTTGRANTAIGAGPGETENGLGLAALGSNTTGNNNTAVGGTNGADPAALGSNTTGRFNTAVGAGALGSNTTGENNIAVGSDAGRRLTTGDYNIDIGNEEGVGGEANTIRIGRPFERGSGQNRAFLAGIFGTEITGSQVGVTEDGQLGVLATSSARFKKEIKPMDKVSEAILALKPVTFQYKKEIDPKGTPQFGLIAEEVAQVNPALIAVDKEGKPYSVRYEAVNAMLLNEFLKEHRKVEKLEAMVAQQHKDFEAALSALKGQIQKVSAQLEVSKPAPQTVKNAD